MVHVLKQSSCVGNLLDGRAETLVEEAFSELIALFPDLNTCNDRPFCVLSCAV